MELKISCSTWMKKEDEIVLKVPQDSDEWLTAQELLEITGMHMVIVQRTLRALLRERKRREAIRKYLENDT